MYFNRADFQHAAKNIDNIFNPINEPLKNARPFMELVDDEANIYFQYKY